MKDKKETCTPCEAEFLEETQKLVDEVEGYNKKDHDAKKREVEAAFGKEDKK
ncbi:hypothetical protein [Paludibacter sp. 221]|uniref:hypothetical protein n=1 Tax=Paludibacter sp. 221 TaxID=2302939 RepID=UPI001943B834|nr:hypothetical protein [Paludibacter sp. 221]